MTSSRSSVLKDLRRGITADKGASEVQERLRDLHLPLVMHRQPVVASHTGATVLNGPNDLTWKTVASFSDTFILPYSVLLVYKMW
jgi:hypothetical protein